MPTPIEYQAVTNLQAALQAISVVGGYHYTVAAASVKLDPNHAVESLINPGGPRPLVLIEVGKAKWEYEPQMQLRLKLPVTAHWVSESTPTDDASRMLTFFKGCADVEQAIAIDVGRGGKASDTRIVGCTFDTAVDGSQVWAQIELEIWLRRTYGQPNG